MTTPDLSKKDRSCRRCGAELVNARYNWTLCRLCYWSDRAENLQAIPDLTKQKNEIKRQLKQIQYEEADARAQENAASSENKLRLNARPWWKKLLGMEKQSKAWNAARHSLRSTQSTMHALERELTSVDGELKNAMQVQEELESARRQAKRMREGALDQDSRWADCRERSIAVRLEYSRVNFHIRNKDYKRGNLIENYFHSRRAWIVDLLGNACIRCGADCDLNFDHFAIPKNEGGNFVLCVADGLSIKMNIVLLCRSCNSSKGEQSAISFLEDETLSRCIVLHEKVVDAVLREKEFLKRFKKWYGFGLGKPMSRSLPSNGG